MDAAHRAASAPLRRFRPARHGPAYGTIRPKNPTAASAARLHGCRNSLCGLRRDAITQVEWNRRKEVLLRHLLTRQLQRSYRRLQLLGVATIPSKLALTSHKENKDQRQDERRAPFAQRNSVGRSDAEDDRDKNTRSTPPVIGSAGRADCIARPDFGSAVTAAQSCSVPAMVGMNMRHRHQPSSLKHVVAWRRTVPSVFATSPDMP